MEKLTDKQLLNSLALAAEKGRYQDFLNLVVPERINDLINGSETYLVLLTCRSHARAYAKIDPAPLNQREKALDRLLELGADINFPGRAGMPVLHWATMGRDANMVKLLLERGADMRIKGEKSEETAMQSICMSEGGAHTEIPISKLFMLRGAKPSEFQTARRGGVTNYRPGSAIRDFYARIKRTRKATTCLLGARNRSPLLKLVGRDIVLQLAKDIYSTRGNPAWSPAVP